jgi:lysophospholipase L1-like esterase
LATRRITDLKNVTSVKDTDLLIVETSEGTKSTSKSSLLNDLSNKLSTEYNELSTEIEVERQRINTFTALGEGSTTGDAELIDARIGIDGDVYSSAGEAIRGQNNQLSKEVNRKLDNFKLSINRMSIEGELIGYALGSLTGELYQTVGVTESYRVSGYCDVATQNPYGTVTVGGLIGNPRIVFYDAKKNIISVVSGDTNVQKSGALELPNGTKYARVQSESDFTSAFINIGSDSNYYEAGETIITVPMFVSELTNDVDYITTQSAKELIETTSKWNGKTWVSYGDSITAQGNKVNGYQRYVDDMLGFAHSYRRGVGGQTYKINTATFYANSDGSYAGRYGQNGLTEAPDGTTTHLGYFASWDRITTMIPENIRESIDLVVLCGGTNDHNSVEDVETDGVISAGTPIWVANSTVDAEWAASEYYNGGDYDINTFTGGIASTIIKMRIWCPNAVVVIATPYPRWNTNTMEQYTNNKGLDFREMCEIQIATAKYMGCPVCDANALSCISASNFAETVTDGVHPNTIGQKLYAKALADCIQSISPKIK